MSRPRGRAGEPDLLARGTTDHYLDAALYDFEYRDREDDIAWYGELAGQAKLGDRPLLELGAGTGRITLPLCRNVRHLIALDAMDAMLAQLRHKLARRPSYEKKVQVVCADFRNLPLPDASVGMVIAPFNALMHLYTWRDLLTAFEETYRVLMPGGRMAFDVQNPDLDWLTWDGNIRHSVIHFEHPVSKRKLVYSTNHTYDPGTQICHVRIYYDLAPPRGETFDPERPPETPHRLVHLAHRQIFPEEIRALLDRAGFVNVKITGDFRNRSLRTGHESQCVTALRPR